MIFKTEKEITDPGQAERILGGLLNGSPSGIAILRAIRDSSNNIVDFEWELLNTMAERFLHRPSIELNGKRLGEAKLDLLAGGLLEKYAEVVETGLSFNYEYHLIQQKEERWLQTSVAKLDEGVTVTFNDITEKKKAEIELLENKQKLEAIFNQASQMIVLLSTEGNVLDINQTALHFLQLFKEEIIDTNFWEGNWWPESETIKLQLQKLVKEAAKGVPARTEIEWQIAGNFYFVEFSLKPILNEKGEGKQLIAEGRDVTGRKEAVSRILQNEVLLTESQKMAHLGSWEWEKASGKVLWSEEMFRIFGYEPFEIKLDFDSYVSFVHPDDKQLVSEALENALKNFHPYSLQHRIIGKDGEERWLLAAGKPLLTGNKKLIKLAGTALDISDQKKADGELLKSVSLYKTMARNMPQSGVLLFDKNLVLTLAEGLALKNMVFEQEPVSGKTASEIYTRQLAGIFIPLLENALRGEETIIERVSSNRYFRIYVIPVRNSSDQIFACMKVMHDITEIKQYEKELERRIEELHRSNMELEQFAYVASHDLQEPLRKIRTFGDRLLHKYQEKISGEGEIYVDRMQNAAARMQVLIDDLLAFSRIARTTEPFTKGDLGAIIRGILDDLEVRIEQTKARITVSNFPEIEFIPSQMRQLFQNLISNALKFSRKNVIPEIEISAEIVDGYVVPTSRNINREGPFCRISVKDNGIGFDIKYLDRIFIIFQRLHGRNEYEGTGIGLAICKKIAEYHNGFITAESKPGEGSGFVIFLPVKQSKNE